MSTRSRLTTILVAVLPVTSTVAIAAPVSIAHEQDVMRTNPLFAPIDANGPSPSSDAAASQRSSAASS